jgi:hypothetical protein
MIALEVDRDAKRTRLMVAKGLEAGLEMKRYANS